MKIFWAIVITVLIQALQVTNAAYGGWNDVPNTQYHIQTDEGPERYFKYQTISGQYRKEKRLEDGTVVGTNGWVDPNGFLRLQDYIADNAGYRVLKSKTVFVGRQRPVDEAVKISKNVPATSGTLVSPDASPNTKILPPLSGLEYSTQAPRPSPAFVRVSPNSIETSTKSPLYVEISPNGISSTTPSYPYNPTTPSPISSTVSIPSNNYLPSSTPLPPTTYLPSTRPSPIAVINSNILPPIPADYRQYHSDHQDQSQFQQPYYNNPFLYPTNQRYSIDRNGQNYNQIGDGYTPQFPEYDGVSVTNNGFKYYLPRQYHEEENSGGSERTGSFGYIDPFGIRRVIYYNTAPGTGFVHRKNNRYVGFNATPYDPRPY